MHEKHNHEGGGGSQLKSNNLPILGGKTKTLGSSKIMPLALAAALLFAFTYLVLALPAVTFISPTLPNASATNNNWVYVNITSSENLTQSLLEWGNYSSGNFTNVTMSNSSITNTTWFVNMTSLSDGVYNYTIFAQNTTGDWNQTEMRFVTIDTTNPSEPTLISPANNTNSTTNTPSLNWTTVTETNFKNYTVQVDDVSTFASPNYNYSTTSITESNYTVTTAWADGKWYWRVIAYDNASNSNTSGYFAYTADTTAPTITLDSPRNGSVMRSGTWINLTVADLTGVNASWWSNNTGAANTSLAAPWDINTSGWSEGDKTIDVWANDSFGFLRRSTYAFRIDDTAPYIAFVSPTPPNGNTTTNNWVYVNTTISDVSNTTAFIDWNRSLVGWWRFNEGAGTTAQDFSSWGNNGTLKNGSATCANGDCPTWTSSGKFGNALQFDGVNDYVIIPDNGNLELNNAYTISFNVKFSTVESIRVLVGRDNGASGFSGRSWIVYISDYISVPRFTFNAGNNTNYDSVVNIYTPSVNTWYNFVAIANGTNYNFYVNGVLVKTAGQTISQTRQTANNFYIGYGDYYTTSVNGTIDEVRIYNRALSPEEINTSYNAGTYRLYHNFTNLPYGTYNYTAYTQDLAGNVNQTETRTITLPAPPPPSVILNSPINNSNQTSTSINFNCTAYDAVNLTNVTLYNNLGGTWQANGTNTSGINNTAYNFSRTAPINGTFIWNCLAYNNASLSSFAPQNFTVTVDGAPPSSNSPANVSYSQNSQATINWTLYDNYAPGYYTVYRNGTLQNQSTWQNNTNLNVWVNTSTVGIWNYTISYNDSLGNNGVPNTVIINITGDTTPPSITFVSPTWNNNTNIAENWEYVNVTLSEAGNVSLLEWNNGTLTNYTMQGSGTNFYLNMTNQNGTITYKVYANDTVGNMNVSETRIVALNKTIDCSDMGSDSIADKIITVCRDTGCNCYTDGINDQVEINFAFNNATAGDTVHINAGTYILNGTIWANNTGVTIEGNGESTILKVIDSATAAAFPQNQKVFYLNADNQTLKDIFINGNWHNQTILTPGQNYLNLIGPQANNILIKDIQMVEGLCDGIRTGTVQNLTIRNVTLTDMSHDALQINAYNSTIENNNIRANYIVNSGIRIYDAYNTVYRNNVISHVGSGYLWMGFEIHSYGNKWLYGLTIENNTIDSNGHHGIWLNSLGGSATTDKNKIANITIRNNIIPSTPKTNYGYGYGIRVQGPSVYNNMTISNNVVHKSANTGIYLENVSTNIIVKNNIVTNSTTYGIYDNNTGISSSYNDVYGSGVADYNCTQGTGDISTDPLFANASSGDFHLQSQAGRWNGTAWVLDAQTSPAIDAGDPTSDYSNEPAPNGGRINMGAYGNTIYASKTYTASTLSVSLNSPQNFLFTSNSTLAFNCSASSSVNLTNITLFGNWSGGWHANQTANVSGTSNSSAFTKTITPDGSYKWNCQANDSAGNSSFAAANYTFTVDTTPPMSVTDLTNQSAGAAWIYWNWTNPADADFNHTEVWLNNTFKQNTSNNYYNATELNASAWYEIQTRTADNAGNINASWINSSAKTLADTTPPTFSLNSANTTIAGNPVNFSVKITDDIGLSGYIFSTNNSGVWINYTWTTLTSGGTAQNITTLNTTAGLVINYTFYANDSSDNWATGRWSITTTANNPPRWSGNASKIASPAVYNAGATYGWQINSSDPDGNMKNTLFQLGKPTGTLTNYSALNNSAGGKDVWYYNLTQNQIGAAGTYNITWFLNDTLNAQNKSETVNYAVNQAPLALLVSPQTQTITYGASATQYCAANITGLNCGIYRNSSSIANNTAIVLAAAVYNFTANITDTANYTVYQNSSLLTINKAATAMRLFLNGTENSSSYQQNQIANFTAQLNISGKNITLASNYTGWVLQNGTQTVFNYTLLLTAANYSNITAFWSGDENYTASQKDYLFNVTADATAPVIAIQSPINGTALAAGTASTTVNITTDENATCRYNLTNSTFAYSEGANFTVTGNTSHWFSLAVADGNTYNLYYKCNDTAGNVNNQSAYHTFSVAAAAATTTPSSGGGGGGGSATSTTKSIAITPQEPLSKITVNLKTAVASPAIFVTKLASVPAIISIDNAYQYLNITKSNFNNSQIENATIDFAVNKSWLARNNIAAVYLARYENGWSRLKTDLTNQTASQNIYRAYTDAFSYFAIAGEKAAAVQPSVPENITQPAAENETAAGGTQAEQTGNWQIYAAIIIAAAALAAAAFALRKQIARAVYCFLPENRKMLKAQKKRFEEMKDGLAKKDRDAIKEYLDEGCAYLAKAEMDEMEKK